MVRQEEFESHVHIPHSGTVSDNGDIGIDQRIADILPLTGIINGVARISAMIWLSKVFSSI
jgi:hypothetical protein